VKRFSFRLERLRQLREHAERAQARTLGAAMREEQERRDVLEQASDELARCREQAADAATAEPRAAGTLCNLDLTRGAAAERVDAAAESLDAAEGVVDVERERFGERRRDLRTVEKLKEKKLEAWRGETAREERREIDGVAQDRHGTGEGKP